MNLRFCSPGKILPYLFYFSLLYLLLWCWKPATAQGLTFNKPLQIGDTVPDIFINNILHYKTPTARLSEFRGRLLILDFWATWCGSCVGMVPRMDSLQKQFDGRIQFISISAQPAADVVKFKERLARQKGWTVSVPEVVGDRVLSKYFPHTILPHYVWIDAAGVIRATTAGDQVTAENIEKFLKSSDSQMAVKDDTKRPVYNSRSTTLWDFMARYKTVHEHYHSFATPYVQGLAGGYNLVGNDQPDSLWRITFSNSSPLWFYKIAFGEAREFFSDHFLALEVSDPSKLKTELTGAEGRAWFAEHAQCYELVVSAAIRDKSWEIFRQDLTKIFPAYVGIVEKRRKTCLALVRTSKQEKFKSTALKYEQRRDGFSLSTRKGLLKTFVSDLNLYYSPDSKYPFVDMTGYPGEVDMDIEGDMSDMKSLNASLARYDLMFVEKPLDIDMLVIKDAPSTAYRAN